MANIMFEIWLMLGVNANLLEEAEIDNSTSGWYKESLDIVLINYFTNRTK